MSSPEWRPDELERRRQVEAGKSVVANLARDHALIAWAKARGAYLRIDRRSRWGNPYRIGRDGTRDIVCEKYSDHLWRSPELLARLGETSGKVLACWCYPERCHGEVLCENGERSASS